MAPRSCLCQVIQLSRDLHRSILSLQQFFIKVALLFCIFLARSLRSTSIRREGGIVLRDYRQLFELCRRFRRSPSYVIVVQAQACW
jgi:hypothetical protein